MAAALTKAEQYEKTRTALLTSAHELFATQGYADTSTTEIVERAEVTRGALYYHFDSKESLFQAVFERLRQARTQAIMARVQEAEGDLWQRFVETGSTAVIESLSDKSAQRIIFTDGPAVLEPDIWHKNVQGVNFITQVFEQLEAEDFIEEKTPHKALARLLWGAFLEAGVYVSHATDSVGAQHEMLQGLKHWLGKLRIKRRETGELGPWRP